MPLVMQFWHLSREKRGEKRDRGPDKTMVNTTSLGRKVLREKSNIKHHSHSWHMLVFQCSVDPLGSTRRLRHAERVPRPGYVWSVRLRHQFTPVSDARRARRPYHVASLYYRS
jgi:hypothetical protein